MWVTCFSVVALDPGSFQNSKSVLLPANLITCLNNTSPELVSGSYSGLKLLLQCVRDQLLLFTLKVHLIWLFFAFFMCTDVLVENDTLVKEQRVTRNLRPFPFHRNHGESWQG